MTGAARGRGGWALLWPAAAVAAALIAFEVGYGAELGTALLLLGYTLGYRIVPGWLLYRFLASEPGGPVKQLALGWVTGMALEIGAFMVTAALDVRWLFALYPLIVALPLVALLGREWRRRNSEPESESEPASADGSAPGSETRWAWGIAALCTLAMGLVAITYFPTVELPGTGSVYLFRDIPYHLAMAADALHHWPIEDPNVAGQPLPYHYFFHLQLAASSQVTGVELPTVFIQLSYLPLVALVALLLVTAGRSLSRNAWIGLLAGFLAFLVADLQLEPDPLIAPQAPFLGLFLTYLFVSPSFTLGLTFLLGLVVVGHRMLTDKARVGPGDWVVLALLAFGASNSKVIALPLMLGALAVFTAWSLWRRGRIPARALGVGGVALLVLVATYLSLYRGHSSGLSLDIFQSFNQMLAVASTKGYLLATLPEFPLRSEILGAGGVVFGLLGLLGPILVGVCWLRGSDEREGSGPGLVWSLSFLLPAIGVLFLFVASGTGDQIYIVQYGIPIAWIAAAAGYAAGWERRPPELRNGPAIAGAVGWVALMVVIIVAPTAFNLFAGPNAVAQTFLFRYAGLALSLLALGLYAWKVLRPRGWWTGALLSAAVLSIGLLGTVSNYVVPGLFDDHGDAGASASPRAVTPELYEAMEWTRDNTPTDAVLAVSDVDPYAFDWAAFAERRVFLSGAAYTRLSLDRGYEQTLAEGVEQLFPTLFQLNADAFAGDPEALATLYSDYGVRYLVVDPRGEVPVDLKALGPFTETAYSDEGAGIQILELQPANF